MLSYYEVCMKAYEEKCERERNKPQKKINRRRLPKIKQFKFKRKRSKWNHNSLYKLWFSIKTRCYNSNHNYYHRYGGRGIYICEDWKNNFVSFYLWAISHGYEKGLQIDRINNDGNYHPNNCRFVTHQQNCRNRSTKLFSTK